MEQESLKFSRETRIAVYPFTRQADGDEVIIGRPDTGTYLALPAEAVEVLDHLSKGKTIGQVQDLYFAEHGEVPDLEDLLDYLEQKSLVTVDRGGSRESAFAPAAAASTQPQAMRYHFANIPVGFARKLFGPASLAGAGVLILLGLLAVALEPSLVPGYSALYFAEDRTLKITVLALVGFLTLFIHEMAHLVAARAVGVSSRLGIGHRLWILVAETDLTALWTVAKNQRYLPLLAGPLVDMTSASVLVLMLFANQRGWIALPILAVQLISAVFFGYLLGLVWQCFFFVRTDLYYVIANYFNCRNLLKDTEDYLKSRASRFLPWFSAVDQSHIPAKEKRVIKTYSLVWIAGRLAAFSVLFFVSLPLIFTYTRDITLTFSRGYSADPYGYLDALAVMAFVLVPMLVGLAMWTLTLTRRWRRQPA